MRTAAAIALLALAANAQETKLEFDVATIKSSDPNVNGSHVNSSRDGNKGKLECHNLTLKQLIVIGYHLRKEQITGGASWTGSDRFDIEAKYELPAEPELKQSLTDAQKAEQQRQFEERVRGLLADRFQLTVKFETRETAIYALVVAKGGPKLKPTKDNTGNQGTKSRRGTMTGTGSDPENIAQALGYETDKPVLDKTGLKGRFDFQLDWMPDPPAGATTPEISGPSLFTAVQEQLGLKLDAQKVPLPFLIIERAEKPSAN